MRPLVLHSWITPVFPPTALLQRAATTLADNPVIGDRPASVEGQVNSKSHKNITSQYHVDFVTKRRWIDSLELMIKT